MDIKSLTKPASRKVISMLFPLICVDPENFYTEELGSWLIHGEQKLKRPEVQVTLIDALISL